MMLLSYLLLLSAFLAPHVLASKKAGPYQVGIFSSLTFRWIDSILVFEKKYPF
jgi:hypothetical protein